MGKEKQNKNMKRASHSCFQHSLHSTSEASGRNERGLCRVIFIGKIVSRNVVGSEIGGVQSKLFRAELWSELGCTMRKKLGAVVNRPFLAGSHHRDQAEPGVLGKN